MFDIMRDTYTLGEHFEAFVQAEVASGCYHGPSEVLREALRLMEERERRLAALDSAIERGVADIEAGGVRDADAVFDDVEAELEALPDRPAV